MDGGILRLLTEVFWVRMLYCIQFFNSVQTQNQLARANDNEGCIVDFGSTRCNS